MKRFLLLAAFIILAISLPAQEKSITGMLTDKKTGEAMVQSTVQLLKSDSTFISGTVSNEKGVFSLKAPSDGNFIVKITNVGYTTLYKNVSINNSVNVRLGKIQMREDAVMLKGATITGQAVKVVLKEDTFIYNASAYKTPEGSVLEELVKKLPGAKIDDSGKITINGKEVKKILVDGKEFMTGDTKTAMKNIPTSIIEKVKAYDQKSDLAKVTGIDDGEEQTVLDFGVKKGMNKGMFSNIDLSVGTHNRYAERIFGAHFDDKIRVMLFGNANNTNDMGFPGGGGGPNFGRSRNGLNATKMLGANFGYEKKDTLQIDGSVRWNHSNSDVGTKSSSENFVATTGSFSNSLDQNYGRSDSWNAQMRLEWKPDTMTDIMFRPTFSYSTNDGRSSSNSASYNKDPYTYVTNPLDPASIEQLAKDSIMVNSRNNSSISYSDSKSVGASLQLNRKFGNMGRNVTLRVSGNYNNSNNKSLSTNNVHLYQVKNSMGSDSTYQTNRYNLTPTKNYSYSIQTTYSEPIWKATFLQFSYQFNYSYSKSDRYTYDFSNLGEDFFSDLKPIYRNWDSYLSRLENPYTDYLDKSLSRYSEYKNYTHEMQVMFRMIRSKYNFNIGAMLQPQKSHFIQNYQGKNVDTTRTVTNFSPTLDFRYRFSKTSNLRINYRGTTQQPSISDMLDITDDSDPLNITKGNPGLKPSFTNTFRLFYNANFVKHQRAVMTYINYQNTRNSISNRVTYNETTGGRISTPDNINGNWNASGAFMYNTSIDTAGVWSVNTSTEINYKNLVGYVSLNRNANSEKNITRSLDLGEVLSTNYRKDWIDVSLDGSLNYQHTNNKLQSESNMNTWSFAYGGSLNIYAPWGTSISTDLHENSRRGYNDNSMNTNELIWNAQISQSLLKGNALTLSLQFYDLLNQQSNFSRVITAMQRSDTQYNSINSYIMLHATYRINAFGGKDSRMQMRDRRDGSQRRFGDHPGGDRPGGGFGPPPGGGGRRGF